jgi:nucleoside 2-deoxyribosyltransferase
MKLYLAHPFYSREKIRKWELELEEKTGIELINPFYDIKREDIEKVDSGEKTRYDVDPTEIVQRDVAQIAREDVRGTIAIIDGNLSYGTIQEMVYSKMLQKPVYSLITNEHENHAWLKYHSRKIFTDEQSLENFLERIS